MVSLESLWLLLYWNVCIFYMLMVLTSAIFFIFIVNEAQSPIPCPIPWTLSALQAVSSASSSFPGGLKTAEMILQNKPIFLF